MKTALMFFDGQVGVYTCIVHDLTNDGAKIELNDNVRALFKRKTPAAK